MGGEVSVTSKVGEGSTFSFNLTLEVATGAEEETEQEFEPVDNFQGARILLVEDNPVNVLIAKTILDNWNCRVEVSNNGQEAIDVLRENEFDLVLMDMRMPVMGGIEATKIIRAEINTEVPIVALTGNAIKGDQEKCLAAGMTDYVSKPFEQKDLNIVLTKLITVKEPDDVPLTDLSSLQAMGDETFISKMITLFIEETQKDMVTLHHSIEARDDKKIKNLAHKMKPSIRYVANKDVFEEIRAIETWNKTSEELYPKTTQLIGKLERIVAELKNR
jgi:CheY-like chemotaxis protein